MILLVLVLAAVSVTLAVLLIRMRARYARVVDVEKERARVADERDKLAARIKKRRAAWDGGDTASLPVTLDEAKRQLADVGTEAKEVVADKGYHSNNTMTGVKERELRSYVSEPQRGRRKWKGKRDAQKATYGNRRRIRGNRGKRLLRQRGEKLERGFAHMLRTGGLRRVHVRRQEEIRKRILIQAAAFNLGLLMRKRFGVGTPRALQGLAAVQAALETQVTTHVLRFFRRIRRNFAPPEPNIASSRLGTRFLHNNTAAARLFSLPALSRWGPISSTAC